MRVHHDVVEIDGVIATACPHYVAGFAASESSFDDDLEEAGAPVAAEVFLLDGISRPDGVIRAIGASDRGHAARAGAARAHAWCHVRAPRASLVTARHARPISATPCQPAETAAQPAVRIVRIEVVHEAMVHTRPFSVPLCQPAETAAQPAVRIIRIEVVHETMVHTRPFSVPLCQPAETAAQPAVRIVRIEVVHEAAVRSGVLPRLPSGVSVGIVSSLDPPALAHVPVGNAGSAYELSSQAGGICVVLGAGQLLYEAGS